MSSNITDRRAAGAGLAWKAPVIAALTTNLTLSGEQTVDGIALVEGDRVLAAGQTTSSQNGIYLVQSGAWERAPDWDGSGDVVEGTLVSVNRGTLNGDKVFEVTTTGDITIGTTGVTLASRGVVITTPVAINSGGTGSTTASAARTALDVPGLGTSNTFTGAQQINNTLGTTGAINILSAINGNLLVARGSDDGAGGGPNIINQRDSATPAASDLLGTYIFQGKDSAGNFTSYSYALGGIIDPTDGTEDGRYDIRCITNAVDTLCTRVGPGLQVGTAPSGGDKGVGTINVDNGYYLDGQPIGQTITFSADKGGAGADTLTSATPVQIVFGTENWDIGSAFATNAWTPPAGKYHITCSVEVAATNGVDNELLTIALRKAGSDHRLRKFNRPGTGACTVCIDALVDANGTDAFTIFVTKGGAGNGATTTTATLNFFQGTAL